MKPDNDEVQNLSEALTAVGESISGFQKNLAVTDASLVGPALTKGRRLLREALEFAADLDATLREIRFLPPPPASVASELRRIAARIDARPSPDGTSVRRDLLRVLARMGQSSEK